MELEKKKERSYFPDDILEEIFLRLPRKSLCRFKCLSKLYYALFGSGNFQNMRHELIYLKDNPNVMLYDRAKNNERYTINYKSVSSLLPLSASSLAATTCDCHEFANRVMMDYPSIFQDYDKLVCWSSCCGLRLIRTIKGSCEGFYIWNTITKWCEKIPMTLEVNVNNLDGYGFSCDNKTDDYKFIIIVANRAMKCSDVVVYTLRSSSWRRIQSIPYYLDNPNYYSQGVKLDGALHWLVRHAFEEGTTLVCFDIVNEKFKEVALPEAPMPYPEEPLEKDMFDMRLAVFEGCLCLGFHVFSVRIDIWMMQEYEVRESWVKIFSSCLENLTTNVNSQLIWYFKNSETLWRVDHDGDLIYDPNNKGNFGEIHPIGLAIPKVHPFSFKLPKYTLHPNSVKAHHH